MPLYFIRWAIGLVHRDIGDKTKAGVVMPRHIVGKLISFVNPAS